VTALTLSRPALVARPLGHVPTITCVDDNCDTCFGTGEIFAKPGVYKPCPACCGGFTAAAVAPVLSAGPVGSIGCLECMHDCGGIGCGCTCCCSYEPAVAAAFAGRDGFLGRAAQ